MTNTITRDPLILSAACFWFCCITQDYQNLGVMMIWHLVFQLSVNGTQDKTGSKEDYTGAIKVGLSFIYSFLCNL